MSKKKIVKFCMFGIVVSALVAGIMIIDNGVFTVQARGAGFHVVVDAGHGGRDGGAVSRSGTKESDLNLKIAKQLCKELESNAINVTMTRRNHDSLASPFAKNQKKDDMNKRRQIIEKAKPDLVISIHLNNFISDRSVRGLQCFFDGTSEISKQYAESIQNTFNTSGLNINRRARTGDLYILSCTAYPSVLIECGFLSNPDEERLLKTAEYQKILAHYIATAVKAQLTSG